MSGEQAMSGDLVGRVLLGRYRVVRELAKGGMGVVYLARAEGAVGFVKPVVIKLVLPEHAEDQRFVGMFVREAQILSQLRHPSVVDVLEFGEQDGAYVLVLEYVRGYHLGQWMRYLWMKKREAPVEILIQVVIDVLDALHHAHNQMHPDGTPMQIVHRDVSPSNILLDEDGRGRLLDFGVARMRSSADEKTQFKGFMGKLPYTAPEVFADTEASPKSDLYACGVVLHELLIGRNVFRSENQAATMHRVMTHVPESVESARPGVPVGLDAVLVKALAKAPADRYPDARAFAGALRKLQREQESDVRQRLADLLRVDFGTEMAGMLHLESLADRDEAWRKLSQPPPRHDSAAETEEASESRARVPEARTGKSGALPRVELAPPPAAGATVANSPGGRGRANQQTPTPSPGPSPEPVSGALPSAHARHPALAPPAPAGAPAPAAASSNRGMMIGLGAVGVLALVAIALSLRPQAPPPPPPAPPQIRVVAQPNAVAPGLPPAPAPAPAPAEDPAAAAADSDPRPRARPDARRSGPDAQVLTRAFRKQQPRLEACFEQHPAALRGQTTQLEFDLDAKGKLTHVSVIPRSLASTPLGDCLLKIARATDFPAQGQPVSFAIPVTASRGK